MKDRVMRHTLRRQNGDLSPITLRIADACRITGIGRSKFYELIKAGEIGVIKVGAITLVPMSGLRTLLKRGLVAGAEPAQCSLATAMHPILANSILTASIAGTSDAVRRDLSSKDEGARTRAEDHVVERMIAALHEPHVEMLGAA